MKKFLGYILTYALVAVGVVMASPLLLGILLLIVARKVQCWATNKHIYDYRLLLANVHVSQLRCTRCNKAIVPDEHSGVMKEVESYINYLHATKEYLNKMFVSKTPDEQAIEDLLKETRGNGGPAN